MNQTREWGAERSAHYGNRLRDLITEALQDGVVLSIEHEPEKLGFCSTTPADWITDTKIFPIPMALGVRHEHLPNPTTVTAKVTIARELAKQQPEEGILYDVTTYVPRMPKIELLKKAPDLEPTYNGSRLFVNPSLVQPWATADKVRMTSALAFGNVFDFIGLTQDPAEPNQCGVLDACVLLDKVWYQLAGSDTVFVESVLNLPYACFVIDPLGDYSTLRLDFEFGQARNGKILKAKIYGKINLQTGTVEVNCAQQPEAELKLVGYKLKAQAGNPNLR